MLIYIDRDSGTYFTEPPIEIGTARWDDYDHDVFSDVFTDRQRSEYAEMVNSYVIGSDVLTPGEWLEQYQCQLCDTTATDAGIEGGVCAACFEAMPEGEWVSK